MKLNLQNLAMLAAAISVLLATGAVRAAPMSLYVVSGTGTPDAGGARIYELNPDTGTVLNTIIPPVPELVGTGLAFSGTVFYYSNETPDRKRSIYTIDPSSGAVLNSFPTPGPYSTIGALGYGYSSFGPTLYSLQNDELDLLDPPAARSISASLFQCGDTDWILTG
jgi:outer membrane protein assembly factor BamB